jgi:Zn-finger nucleic acid-binding protein
MNCPVDGTTLAMADRQGVEIDYCPQCRGVWLDRGELDKLIEREAAAPVAAARVSDRPRHHDDDDDDNWVPVGGKKRKRKGFLSEMFEFGD